MQVVEVVELALDGFGDRNGLGVGEGAEVAARAADDVGEEAKVRRVETQQPHLVPERHQLILAHIGEHQLQPDLMAANSPIPIQSAARHPSPARGRPMRDDVHR